MSPTHVCAIVLVLGLASPASAAEKRVPCKDGTTAKAWFGACIGHGGVVKRNDEVTRREHARSAVNRDAPPIRSAAPGRAVTCKDGTTSRRGSATCSGHGGIAMTSTLRDAARSPRAQARPAPRASARDRARDDGERDRATTDRDDAIARCRDGLYSHARSRSGACVGHGGVDRWLDR
jgi:hypothetical protein